MRSLVVLAVFASPIHAADKEEDKAKEVAAAFLKGFKTRDLDAVMKTVGVPFQYIVGEGTIEEPDRLKQQLSTVLALLDPNNLKGLEVGKFYDMAAIAKYAKEKNMPEFAGQAEKLVGKSGCMVMLVDKGKEIPGVLIRFKDGKALIAGVPK